MFQGKTITKYRKEIGLTQTELANELGVTQGAVCSWENNIKIPTTSNLAQIAKILNCSINDFFTNSDIAQ